MSRSPKLQEFVDNFTQNAFGRTMTEDCCVVCGSKKVKDKDFKDPLSKKGI